MPNQSMPRPGWRSRQLGWPNRDDTCRYCHLQPENLEGRDWFDDVQSGNFDTWTVNKQFCVCDFVWRRSLISDARLSVPPTWPLHPPRYSCSNPRCHAHPMQISDASHPYGAGHSIPCEGFAMRILSSTETMPPRPTLAELGAVLQRRPTPPQSPLTSQSDEESSPYSPQSPMSPTSTLHPGSPMSPRSPNYPPPGFTPPDSPSHT
jgi:hypothetical protein